jgi:ubiquinone/menaquinone biosynthesis C-methylase UbiE
VADEFFRFSRIKNDFRKHCQAMSHHYTHNLGGIFMAGAIDTVDQIFAQPTVTYRQEFKINRLWHADCRQIIDVIGIRNSLKLLDLGCGSGKLIFTIADLIENFEMKGIDLDAKKIEAAQAMLEDRPNIEFSRGDAARLPFDADYFDVVTCTSAFYYIEHKGKVLQEAYRVLKPEGKFIMLESLRGTSYKNKLDKMMRQSPFIKYSRRFLNRTALFAKSYLITCQK